ncbi:DUF1566 domain-containing protein [Legionella sp. PC997]|uniref:Lcl C-terminal domain-containing protein n=1 Tax=Legionella sp. PC997 TaxID=2755562 RepID=UPI0015FA0749|nr:DUF1566 domain-containing protein [Legionella sp. PC997]QMT62087.1 hypothetical protein HBNCFIEN_03495 [Legionella sp. PC997]
MNKNNEKRNILIISVTNLLFSGTLCAETPIWTFSAPHPKSVTVSDRGFATVIYTVTNQSRRAKSLVLKPTQGLSASVCNLAGRGSICELKLTINGSLVPPQGIHSGPILCEQNNPNQCYQPSPNNILQVSKNTINTTSLQVSVNEQVLSVTGLSEYGILTGKSVNSGRERSITITNTGAIEAMNVMYTTSPGLPIGTTISPSSCGTIAPSNTCVLTIKPGRMPSATIGDANPKPVRLSILGTNTNTVHSAIHVLAYGSMYQGGYVFAFDDTKGCISPRDCKGSVRGKIVTTKDQASGPFPGGVPWSSNGTSATRNDVSNDFIPGIALNSTSSVGIPSFSALASMFDYNNGGTTYTNLLALMASDFEACAGKSDGACNTRNIVKFYNTYVTNYSQLSSPPFTAMLASTNPYFYAAGLCTQSIAGHNDWYLPAICEMGYDDGSSAISGCGIPPAQPLLQNIQSNLVEAGISEAPSGLYWSSSEDSYDPSGEAWIQGFNSNGSYQNNDIKRSQRSVRCVRVF